MSLLNEYLCGAVDLTLLVGDAKAKVRWAAEPVKPGEKTKAQIYRAFQELRMLPHELVRATWYGQCGPYQYPYIHNAWLELLKRRAEVYQQFQTPQQKAWLVHINDAPLEIASRSAMHLVRTKQLRRTG